MIESTIDKATRGPAVQAIDVSGLQLVKGVSCAAVLQSNLADDTTKDFLRIAPAARDYAISVFRRDGKPLELAPQADITPQETLRLCQLMVRACCFNTQFWLGSRDTIQEYIETNGLCRHFRKVPE